MDPVWVKSYEPGVPATINADAYASLNALFAEAFKKYPDLPAFTNMGQTLSYAEIDQKSRHFAAYLQTVLGLKRGDRFAIMMPNLLQYPIALLGILRAGCVVVNVNPLYTPDELEHQLNDAQVSGIIVLENFAHTVSAALPRMNLKNIIVTRISDVLHPPKSWIVDFVVKYLKRMVPAWKLPNAVWFNDVLAKGAQANFSEMNLNGQDLAFLQYTGGTTGVAKGAMLTHRNMVANMMQATAWLSRSMLPRQEIIITALPMYHIFSLTANCLTFINYGALNVLITNPRDTKAFIKDLKKFKFTAITGVNTLYNLLLNQKSFAEVDFSALKIALGGGMAVQKVVAERWFNLTKRPLIEAYGLTETSPAACINPMNLDHYNGSIGLPVPSTEIAIRDEQGKDLDFEEVGELCIRGPQVMRGYWNNEAETRNVLGADGWLKTGDMAKVDKQGFVYIVDRKKDMIVISGFKVFPTEVEGVIAGLAGVLEVAVVGVPDEQHGEIVKAFIVKKDKNLQEHDILEYCKQHLTGYKIPHVIEFRDSLPKTNVGKILRRELR